MAGMTFGFDLSKALGVADGIGTYSRLLLAALVEAAPGDRFRLYDLRSPRVDRERLAEVAPGLPADRVEVVDGPGPANGDVDAFMSPAFKTPPRFRGPLVYTVHDVTFVSHARFHVPWNRVEVLTETVAAVCAGATLLAVSEATRDETVAWLGVEAERLAVVHSAADPVFRPPPDPARKPAVLDRLGVGRPYLLTVGSIEPRKNLAGLLEAFSTLAEPVRDAHALVVVGAAGWLNESIHARLAELAARLEVVFAGAVEQGELVELYGAARAFAYPSFAEGFGLPVLEAMACGVPVVTSNLSSLPEIAGAAAELVDPHDTAALAAALERVLVDDRRRAELVARGLERAARFSWADTARGTLELLRAAAVCGRSERR